MNTVLEETAPGTETHTIDTAPPLDTITNSCLKKYCDCFRFNLKCTDKCVCKECENMAPEGTLCIEQV